MKLCTNVTILTWIAVFLGFGAAQVTWPNSIDELEDVMFLNTGYRSRGFSAPITPCSFSAFGPGRQTAAEWLRAGFHDMSTTNVYNPPHGGIDASLAFELNDGENIGAGFNTTFVTYGQFYNSRLSVSDLVALGVYASTRTCGGPVIPMRGGRIDATAAGPMGVPQPQNGQGTFLNQFTRMGFNATDMIKMTACGHTLGGVHAGDFPNIVAPGTVANDFQLFDNTETFDNAIATRYVNGPDTDPLAVGISISSGRNSDTAVFTADNNVTLQAMTNAATFNSMCADILQRMIEVVDPTIVTLSPIIQPYEVKPAGLQLTLLSGGTLLTFSGNIRVRTTVRSASQISSVQLIVTDRNGASAGTLSTSVAGTAAGFDDTFSFYSFSSNLPVTTSISSFTVVITLTSGTTQTYNNNGGGFPVSDSVIVQTPQSCLSSGNLTVLAAIRSTVTTPVSMSVTQKVARNSGSPIASPVPSLVNATIAMVKGATIGPSYNIYSASYTIASVVGTKYGVTSGSSSDTFKDPADLGATCSTLGATGPSSTSSSSSVVSTITSSSATSTPTLGIKQTIGAYSFQGCYTEGDGIRALTGAVFYNYTGMTLEQCESDCSAYAYWGVEYGGECYCGNSLNTGSVLAQTQSDCSFLCPGDSYEYCGAGNRLEMYLLSSMASSSSSAVSSTSSVSSSSSVSNVFSTTSSSSSKSTTASGTSSLVSSSSKTSTSSSSKSSTVSSTSNTSASSSVTPSKSSTVTSTTATPTLGIKQTVGAYAFQGCYTEGTNTRALTGAAFYNYTAMTLEMCLSDCAGYAYWGVEYGGECYCGNSLNTGSVPATLSDCSFTCPGDNYEFCGAGNRLEMYMLSSTGSSSSASSTRSSSGSVTKTSSSTTSFKIASTSSSPHSTSTKSISSTLSTTPKTSSSASSKISTRSSSSSLKTSTSTSSSKSSTAFSPSSSSTKSSSSSTKSTSSSSSSLKTSSSTKIGTTTSSSSSSATPTQTAPAIKATIGNYSYYGCQTEATNMRALSAESYYNYPAMTLEMCAQDCNGYKYWGVEYGGECYCGNSFNAGSVNATESDCNFACPGDSLEFCGAGNRLSAYYLSS